MSHWKQRKTRCRAKKKDGVRCKMSADKGEYLCEHHDYDIRGIIRKPLRMITEYAKYFPKQHHPACDRKGKNDCDCPDLPLLTLGARALKRAFTHSLHLTPIHKRYIRLLMQKRTKQIRSYYKSIDTIFIVVIF